MSTAFNKKMTQSILYKGNWLGENLHCLKMFCIMALCFYCGALCFCCGAMCFSVVPFANFQHKFKFFIEVPLTREKFLRPVKNKLMASGFEMIAIHVLGNTVTVIHYFAKTFSIELYTNNFRWLYFVFSLSLRLRQKRCCRVPSSEWCQRTLPWWRRTNTAS